MDIDDLDGSIMPLPTYASLQKKKKLKGKAKGDALVPLIPSPILRLPNELLASIFLLTDRWTSFVLCCKRFAALPFNASLVAQWLLLNWGSQHAMVRAIGKLQGRFSLALLDALIAHGGSLNRLLLQILLYKRSLYEDSDGIEYEEHYYSFWGEQLPDACYWRLLEYGKEKYDFDPFTWDSPGLDESLIFSALHARNTSRQNGQKEDWTKKQIQSLILDYHYLPSFGYASNVLEDIEQEAFELGICESDPTVMALLSNFAGLEDGRTIIAAIRLTNADTVTKALNDLRILFPNHSAPDGKEPFLDEFLVNHMLGGPLEPFQLKLVPALIKLHSEGRLAFDLVNYISRHFQAIPSSQQLAPHMLELVLATGFDYAPRTQLSIVYAVFLSSGGDVRRVNATVNRLPFLPSPEIWAGLLLAKDVSVLDLICEHLGDTLDQAAFDRVFDATFRKLLYQPTAGARVSSLLKAGPQHVNIKARATLRAALIRCQPSPEFHKETHNGQELLIPSSPAHFYIPTTLGIDLESVAGGWRAPFIQAKPVGSIQALCVAELCVFDDAGNIDLVTLKGRDFLAEHLFFLFHNDYEILDLLFSHALLSNASEASLAKFRKGTLPEHHFDLLSHFDQGLSQSSLFDFAFLASLQRPFPDDSTQLNLAFPEDDAYSKRHVLVSEVKGFEVGRRMDKQVLLDSLLAWRKFLLAYMLEVGDSHLVKSRQQLVPSIMPKLESCLSIVQNRLKRWPNCKSPS